MDVGTPFVPTEQPDSKKPSHWEHEDAGEKFLNWLQTGLASGDIITNDVCARVHALPEGVLIVSHAIFKDFARHSDHDWNHIQKRFQKLGLHEKTPQGTNIHNYRTIGGHKAATINGLLLQDGSIRMASAGILPGAKIGCSRVFLEEKLVEWLHDQTAQQQRELLALVEAESQLGERPQQPVMKLSRHSSPINSEIRTNNL